MRANELVEKFNEVIRLTQEAWSYEGRLARSPDSSVIHRMNEKMDLAERAAAEFCKLLADYVPH